MKEIVQYNLNGKCFVLCMKGIEADTGKRLTEIVKEYTNTPTAIGLDQAMYRIYKGNTKLHGN